MRAFLLFLALVASSATASRLTERILDTEWEEWKLKHDKSYESDTEEQFRKRVYEENLLFIAQHNENYEAGLSTYALDANELADRTDEELFGSITDSPSDVSFEENSWDSYSEETEDLEEINIPKEFNWVQRHAVTPPRDQKLCYGAWAFSAVEAVESHVFIKTKKLVPLSAQNLVDCAVKSNGCSGGATTEQAFGYIKKFGINTEKSYPFKGAQNKCLYQKKNVGAKISGSKTLPSGDEQDLMHTVAKIGPVVAKIDIRHKQFFFYKKGVIVEPKCHHEKSKVNHYALIVGYGEEHGKRFWLLKNSWGPTWGEGGFFKLAKDKKNMCGVATECSYPVV